MRRPGFLGVMNQMTRSCHVQFWRAVSPAHRSSFNSYLTRGANGSSATLRSRRLPQGLWGSSAACGFQQWCSDSVVMASGRQRVGDVVIGVVHVAAFGAARRQGGGKQQPG